VLLTDTRLRGVAVRLTELLASVVEIARYVIRHCRIYGNVPPRQIPRTGIAAMAPTVCERRPSGASLSSAR
jgi:hypothetical protein